MILSRREFLQISGGVAALAVIGGLFSGNEKLRGSVEFVDWRALPGMRLGLLVDVERPERTQISIVAKCDGDARVIATYRGASRLEIEMPCIETREESFELYAIAEDERHRMARSRRVEVLSRPFMFGV